MEKVIVRKILPKEFGILDEMLYEAIFQPEGFADLDGSIVGAKKIISWY